MGRPSLAWTLAVGLALRLPAVLFADGYEFKDQQFQYVDPGWHLASGDDWVRTHEWEDGLRSWVYPVVLAGVFRALDAAGLEGPLARMRAVRAVHALFGLVLLAAFWLVVVRWRPVERPRPVLLFFAASGAVVHAAVQPAGPNFAATLSATAVLLFLGRAAWAPLLSGLLLGLAFCCRFQDALFGPILLGAALWRRNVRHAVLLALGCAGPLLLQGFVDRATWGSFFASPLAYVRFNLIEGKSAQWSTRPFWFYVLAGLVPYVVLVPPFLRASWRALRRGADALALPLVAALVYIALHSAIPRKSLRFLLPSFVLLSAVLAVGLYGKPLTGIFRWHRRITAGVHVALLLVLSLHFFNRGPVRAAAALGEHPDFNGELVIVDGGPTSIGGAYYLHRPRLLLHEVVREGLDDALRERRPCFLLVVRRPLSRDVPGVELLGEFTNLPDISRSRRRYLYRAR